MFKPIRLTEFEEILLDDDRDSERTEESKLEGRIGIHAICGGFVYIHRVSLTHKAIFCMDCCLRITVPAEVKTYADLREYLKEDKAIN